jgi:hypothetical protein
MLKNELLQQAQAKIEEGVKNKDAFAKLLKAGSKVIYDKEIFGQLSQGIAQSEDPVGEVAKGLVVVLKMLAQRSRGTVPLDALLQAGMALLFDALDFMEQAGLVKVDKKVLGQATTEFIEALMPTLGLPAGKLAESMQAVKQTMADPQRMAQYQAQNKGSQQ